MKKIFTLGFFALISAGAFSQVSPMTYTTPGNYTFTIPIGVSTLSMEAVGAGGSGGGNGTGGGGGGGFARGSYPVAPGITLVIKVGAPGAGPAAGTSSVFGYISATGGANGVSVPNPSVGGGGAGGVGSGGNIVNFNGGNGGGGYYTYFGGGGGGAGGPISNGSAGGNTPVYNGTNCLTPGGSAGASGGPPGGNGGKGAGFTNSLCSVSDPAANGGNFGGGGGGGNGIGSTPGTGGNGYVKLSWIFCTPPSAPTNTTPPANLLVCGSGTTILNATGSGTVSWYTSPTGTTSVGSGTSFTTPNLTTTTTFYAEAFTCSQSFTRTAITVSVNPNPTVSAVSNVSLLCVGQSATLTANGASGYTWNPGGTNGNSVVVSPTINTTYTVTGSLNSCSDFTTFTQNVSVCSGISSNNGYKTDVSVFPNPFSDKITISNPNKTEIKLQIYNSLGSIINTTTSEKLKIEIDLNSEPAGIYFIKMVTEKGNLTKKIIKE